jgi:hypothetical protein
MRLTRPVPLAAALVLACATTVTLAHEDRFEPAGFNHKR